MKSIILTAVFVTIFFIMTPSRSSAAVYRYVLTDNSPILTLSQRFSIELLEVNEGRKFIFIEFVDKGNDTYELNLRPKMIDVRYKLYDSAPHADLNRLILKSDTSSTRLSRRSSENKNYYLLDETSAILQHVKVNSLALLAETVSITSENLTAVTSNSEFSITFDPNAITENFNVEINTDIVLPLPSDRQLLSSIYQFDIREKDAIDLSHPLSLNLKYDADTFSSKSLNYFDKNKNEWIKLPSYNDVEEHHITAPIHLSYAPIAIFEDLTSEDGIASWYAFRDCLCAASRDFPKGSTLKVTRLKSKESVIVTINDYGPELWTGRLIDLDKRAFERIGSLGVGLIYVNVLPISIHD